MALLTLCRQIRCTGCPAAPGPLAEVTNQGIEEP